MCNKAVDKDPWSLAEVPEHFKTQEMCNKEVRIETMFLIVLRRKICVKKPSKIIICA